MYDAGEIVQGLWMGPVPEKSEDVVPFDVIVNLFGRFLDPSKVTLLWLFDDKPQLPDLNILMAVARAINQFRFEGKNVLVHCQGGLNRSGLVVGTAIAYDGFAGKSAVERIRNVRGKEALNNERFRSFVEGL